ncbi:MAG TPA: CHAD domain-containing protein [Thermomicrobiales bacterium]|nr:CHAD domain-containing protein [Thermomicrobiales bacterium]
MAKARKIKGLDRNAPVIENAARIIAVRLDEMYQFAPYVEDPENIEEIHNLRIAAKRLRYTLEMFRFAFPKGLKALIDEVKAIQSAIGDMRDADIMIETVQGLLAGRAAARAERLMDIATAAERGTLAQRKQRIGEALAAPTVLRDDVAYYTLIAHKSDVSRQSYQEFLAAWRAMEATDFYGRLRRFVGIDPPEPEVAPIDAGEDIVTDEQVRSDELPEALVDVEPGE